MHCVLKGLKVKKCFCYKETVMKWVSAIHLYAQRTSSGTIDWLHCIHLHVMLQQPLVVCFFVSCSPCAVNLFVSEEASTWSCFSLILFKWYTSVLFLYSLCFHWCNLALGVHSECSQHPTLQSKAAKLHCSVQGGWPTFSLQAITYCTAFSHVKIPPLLSTLHVNGVWVVVVGS